MLEVRFVVKNWDVYAEWLTVQRDFWKWIFRVDLFNGEWVAAHISVG